MNHRQPTFHLCRWQGAIALLLFTVSLTLNAQTILTINVPVERELATTEKHTYSIAMNANQFLRVVVAQPGIDVVVKLSAPSGEMLAQVNNPDGLGGDERLSFIANKTGAYTLEVSTAKANAERGKYSVKIAALRAATIKDQSQVAAERLFDEADQLRLQQTAESRRAAIKKFEEAAPLFAKAGDKAAEANALRTIGTIHGRLSEFAKAAEYYAKAIEAFRLAGDKRNQAETHNSLGAVYFYTNQQENSFAQVEQAATLYRELNDKRGEAESLGNLGSLYHQAGQSRKGLAYFLQSLPVLQAEKDQRNEARTLSNIASIYDDLGEPQPAMEHYQRALALRRQLNDRRGIATTLHNLATVYKGLGEAQKALDAELEALSIVGESGEKFFLAAIRNTMGTLYEDLGQADKAIDSYGQALQLARDADNKASIAATLANIGGYHARQGDASKGLEYQTQALQLMREVKDLKGEALTLVKLGESYALLNDKAKALEYYNLALPLCRQIENRNWEAHVLELIGKTQVASGKHQQALEYYSQALQLTRAISQRTGEASTLYAMAVAERQLGKLSEAQTRLEAALNLLESLRNKVTREDLRASFWASKQDVYEFYIDLLMARHRTEPSRGFDVLALKAKERARTRSLLDLLNEATANIRQGIDPQLLAKERQLQASINAKETKRLQLLALKKSEKQGAELTKELAVLLEEYQQLQATIRARSPQYAALMQAPNIELKDIQQALDADTVLLEYFLNKDRSYVWAITATNVTSVELPPSKTIEALVQQAYAALTYRNQPDLEQTRSGRRGLSELARLRERERQSDGEFEKAATALSRMILNPVANQLDKKRLLIVADGALQYLPFNALPEPKNSGFTPLIAGHEVVSLPSFSSLLSLRRTRAARQAPAGLVAVVADPVFSTNDPRVGGALAMNTQRATPSAILNRAATETGARFERLPHTKLEAEAIERLGNSKGKTLLAMGFAASRDTIEQTDLSQFRIVHFATHGLLNSQHPELSGLVFSLLNERGQAREGFLRLHDVFNLKLNADLVVLSGCQTAMGKEVRGEGLIGLTRGFLYAGSSRVMASLWSVQDKATADLMKRFYARLLGEGVSASEALRLAQLEMWKEQRAPYYWAAFTLQGDWAQ
ncbi:MAG TPA: CHAT domain-containing tetratricopeptide repeat protein [Blastocatellia bacterium]|nr:CHAT domain-containing tetratricopeptide repeat protein [Blastocatellia bacterium]